jgi:hypothetical protein
MALKHRLPNNPDTEWTPGPLNPTTDLVERYDETGGFIFQNPKT